MGGHRAPGPTRRVLDHDVTQCRRIDRDRPRVVVRGRCMMGVDGTLPGLLCREGGAAPARRRQLPRHHIRPTPGHRYILDVVIVHIVPRRPDRERIARSHRAGGHRDPTAIRSVPNHNLIQRAGGETHCGSGCLGDDVGGAPVAHRHRCHHIGHDIARDGARDGPREETLIVTLGQDRLRQHTVALVVQIAVDVICQQGESDCISNAVVVNPHSKGDGAARHGQAGRVGGLAHRDAGIRAGPLR